MADSKHLTPAKPSHRLDIMEAVLRHAPAIVTAYDVRTGQYLFINDGVETLLGYSRTKVLQAGLPFVNSLIHPDDASRIAKENQAALASADKQASAAGPVVGFEYRLRHKDGSWRWMHTDGMVFGRDSNGKVTHIINITVDITERKQAESDALDRMRLQAEASDRSEERMQLILSAAQMGVWEWDFETGVLHWSKEMREICGAPPDEVITYEKALEFHHPDDQPHSNRIIEKAIRNGGSYRMEYRVVWPDGSIHWVQAQGKVIKRDGKPVAMLGTAQNIDDQKARETELSIAQSSAEDARKQLERSEQRYKAFIANSSEGLWRFELEKPMPIALSVAKQLKHMYRHAYLAEANDALANMYGFRSAKPLIGKRLGDLLIEDDPQNRKYLEAFIRSDYRLIGAESHERDRKGNDKFFSNSLVGIIEDGTVVRAWGTQTDITETKKSEKTLRRSEERLALALRASKTGIWEWDIRRGTLTWSDQLKKIYGLKKSDTITYERYISMLHPDDLPVMKKTIQQARRLGKAYAIEHRVIWPDGSTHWVLGQGQAFLENGKAVRMLGTSMNIDERKSAEFKIKESEGKFRELFDHAPDGIFLIGPGANILDANPAAGRMLGHSQRTLKRLKLADLLKPEHTKELKDLQRSLGTESKSFGEWELRRKDGHYISTEITARRLPDGNWLAFVRDNSEQKAHAEFVQQAQIKQKVLEERAHLLEEQHEQLKLLNKAKDEFISVASHHLRTPASAVKMYLGLVREGYAGKLLPDQESYIKQAFDSNEQQLQVIEDILNVAEMDAERVSLRTTPDDIVKLCKEVIENLAHKFNDRKQKLSFVSSRKRHEISIDTTKMRVVLENIIGNASKYTPEGKRIDIRISTTKHTVTITVTDQGQGISKEDLPKIFDKFARVKNEAYISESGTGLGLYWAKRIVGMHGGDITVTSELGKGSVFAIKLPVE